MNNFKLNFTKISKYRTTDQWRTYLSASVTRPNNVCIGDIGAHNVLGLAKASYELPPPQKTAITQVQYLSQYGKYKEGRGGGGWGGWLEKFIFTKTSFM